MPSTIPESRTGIWPQLSLWTRRQALRVPHLARPASCIGQRTGTVYRALLIPELVSEICVHSADTGDHYSGGGTGTLFALSVVNRMFSEHALDLLWARGDSLALLSLIPPEWCPLEQEVSQCHTIH
jgi:hypothetical protein